MKKYFKKLLGVTDLEKTISELQKLLGIQEKIIQSIQEDNRLIINHVKFINKDFSTVADIQYKRDKFKPSVVIVMKQGTNDIVKTYTFSEPTLKEIYRFLEGFGKESVRIDNLKGFSKPDFRY